MSKIEKPKYFLLTKFFVTILKIYRHKLNERKKICYDNFLYKNLKTFFSLDTLRYNGYEQGA